jgi:hypothetical protein
MDSRLNPVAEVRSVTVNDCSSIAVLRKRNWERESFILGASLPRLFTYVN